MQSEKSRSRRAEIRKNRPDTDWVDWQKLKERGVPASLGIAAAFFLVASAILMLRQDVVPYRPGQWLHHDVVSRVKFTYQSQGQLDAMRAAAANRVLRIYSKNSKVEDVWENLQHELLQLPDRIPASPTVDLPGDLKEIFDSGSLTVLRKFAVKENRDDYIHRVIDFVQELRAYRVAVSGRDWPILILRDEERAFDKNLHHRIQIVEQGDIDASRTFALHGPELKAVLASAAQKQFVLVLQPKIVDFAISKLEPTYVYDDTATVLAREAAANEVPTSAGAINYAPNVVIVYKSTTHAIDQSEWRLLRAEHIAYIHSLKDSKWAARVGVAGVVFGITCILCLYIGFYQPRVVSNHPRAIAIAALLLSMLLLNQIAAIGNGPLFLFGTAPTLLVAMILAIGYDQRTAIGIAGLHGLLATVALDQGITFFVVIWVGVMVACFLLDDIRTRSKLIEVGGATAIAMVIVTMAAGLIAFDPWDYIEQNCLYAGASGLTVGFIVLGILPFVEKAFKITTSMTLLELADPSQPLLQRLAMEANGTYNHSLQVGVIAEAAAKSIGVNALLCRVASYYHDVGKINKPEYFIENQGGRENRHINLTPNVSRMIITGHVKDGVELAKEYNLPGSIIAFIQQHHGTTLVEYFFRQACSRQEKFDPDGPEVQDHQYRYDGPRPRSKEVAIVMLADCVESACRTLDDPTASRVEGLVEELSMKRLLDHQFDECDLTMRELELIEKTIIRTVLGIYHGRIAYPPAPAEAAEPETPATESQEPGGIRMA
jgi:hypothetical protein